MKIKFKGKCVGKNKWVYGDLITALGNTDYTAIEDWESGETFEVEPNTVGQYIGINDINNKEVYINDIIHITGTGDIDVYPNDIIPVSLDDDFVVVLDEDNILRVMCEGKTCSKLITDVYFLNDFTIEVVGNIYDNME